MRKSLLIVAVFCAVKLLAEEPYYSTARDAANAANEACGVWGQKAKAGTNDSHTGVMRYGSDNYSESSKKGGQNTTRFAGEAGAFVKGSANYERTGEREDSKHTSDSKSSGYLYYKCE